MDFYSEKGKREKWEKRKGREEGRKEEEQKGKKEGRKKWRRWKRKLSMWLSSENGCRLGAGSSGSALLLKSRKRLRWCRLTALKISRDPRGDGQGEHAGMCDISQMRCILPCLWCCSRLLPCTGYSEDGPGLRWWWWASPALPCSGLNWWSPSLPVQTWGLGLEAKASLQCKTLEHFIRRSTGWKETSSAKSPQTSHRHSLRDKSEPGMRGFSGGWQEASLSQPAWRTNEKELSLRGQENYLKNPGPWDTEGKLISGRLGSVRDWPGAPQAHPSCLLPFWEMNFH